MATFQFKNSKYRVTPPQDGAPSIINEGTADSTYKQDISNLPVSSITSRSVNMAALSQICLAQGVGVWTDNEELRALLQQEYGGYALLDLTKDGKITSQDALIFLRLSAESEAGYSLSIYQRAYKIIEVLEENYEKYKNYIVTYAGITTALYNGPPSSDQGFFDPKQHYIVVDADDPIDRLKLLKYKKGSNLNSSYWYDAGTGNEEVNTQGLVSIDGRASKGSKTSKITANTVTFDGSSASIVNTTTNTITIPNHKFQTGDAVAYTVGTGIEFLAGDSSVVDVANNKIIYQNHGYETGDYITYSVARGGTAIAPLTDGSLLEIEKVDNNSFKLRDRSITTAITFTGLGLGTSKISGSRIPDSTSTVKYQGRLFVISAGDGNSLRFANTYDDAIAGNEISFAGLGVGQTHKLSANYISEVIPGDFVGVYETEVFTNVQVATNTNEITITNHGFNTGDTAVYRLGSGATAAAGIEVGTKYFIRSIDSDTIKIALSSEDAHQSSDSFHVNITSAGNGTQFFEIEYGTKVYKISDDNTLLVNTSDDIVFTNRPIKKSNFALDTGKDVIVSKVFKYRSVATVNGATTSSTTFNFDALYGEKPQIGAILTGQNVSGTPKITGITYGAPGAGGLTGTATLTTSQSLSDNQEIVFESFAQEPYVALDSGDSLQDDLAPQLGNNLDLNGQAITDSSNSFTIAGHNNGSSANWVKTEKEDTLANATRQVWLGDNGNKLFSVDDSGVVYEWDLSTAYDVSVTGSQPSASWSSGLSGEASIWFNDNGTQLLVMSIQNDILRSFPLSTNWDISTVGSATATRYLTSAVDNRPVSVFFGDGGTKLFILGAAGTTASPHDGALYSFNLSTAYDLSTMPQTGGDVASAPATTVLLNSLETAQITNPQKMFFDPYGQYLHITCGNREGVVSYFLSTPWDITTMSYNGALLTSGEAASVYVDYSNNIALIVDAELPGNKIQQYSINDKAMLVDSKSSRFKGSIITHDDIVCEKTLYAQGNAHIGSDADTISIGENGGNSLNLVLGDGADAGKTKTISIGGGGNGVSEVNINTTSNNNNSFTKIGRLRAIGGDITIGDSITTNTIDIGSAATTATPSANTQTVNIGCNAGTSGIKRTNIGNGTGQSSQYHTVIGSSSSAVTSSTTTIYGSTVIEHGNSSANPISIGGTYQSGSISLGKSQVTQTIQIGSTYSALTRTQAINIGSHASGSSTNQVITIGGSGCSQTISINPNSKTSNVYISGAVPSTGNNIVTQIGATNTSVGTGTVQTHIKSTTKALIVESNATSLNANYSGILMSNTPAGSGNTTILSMHQYEGTNKISSYYGPGSPAALTFDFASVGEKGRFHTNGNFGLGATNPSAKLHVVGDIIATGNITAYYSDERLKDLKGAIPNALEKVNKLTGYYYKPNALAHSLGVDNTDLEVGVSAQEVEEVLPEIVTKSAVGTDAFGEDYKSVHYDKLTPLLIEAVKELTKKVEILEKRLNEGE